MHRLRYRTQVVPGCILLAVPCLVLNGLVLNACRSVRTHDQPSIEFSHVPPGGEGSPDKFDNIEGRVTGTEPGDRVVLFARSGVWWVQPIANQPFTGIQPDSTWKNSTHPGSAYAALLVDSRYHPPATVQALPEKGGPVLAVAIAERLTPRSPPRTLQFSGYQWEIRNDTNDRGGTKNVYDPANAWTDNSGFLHLVIDRHREGQEELWRSAEIQLSRSLGYGSYRFVVRDVAHLEPAAVFGIFSWDDTGPTREWDIEVSRWGEPENKNAQFVIQPYVVPANTVRFNTPPGTLTWWADWQPGRVAFRTIRGSSSNMDIDRVAGHVFTSGVPSPGNEKIHMNLYVFGNRRNPLRHESEVIVEKFEFLP